MAEEITFLPFERSGLAKLTGAVPVNGRLAGNLMLQARDLFGRGPLTAALSFELVGAGDVEGLQHGAILRAAPRPETSGAETTKCVHVEFVDADLPWRYTPLHPIGNGLKPWLVVIVGTTDELEVQNGFVVTHSNQLWIDHDLNHSARWAHVQDDGNGNRVGRVFSPRQLQPQREHVAAIVPAFVWDANSGQIKPAWSSEAPAFPLPAYYSWRFWTAEAGDFETLAAALRPVPTGNLGTAQLQYAPSGESAIDLPVGGAITSLKSGWFEAADETDLQKATADLDRLSHPEMSDGLGRRVLGLPEYGSPWITKPEDTKWGKELNNDPRLRGMAGLGLWIGILEQEELIDVAVQQFGAMNDLRRLLRDLALGLLAAQTLWDRRLPDEPEAQMWLFGAAMGRLPTAGGTVLAALTGLDRPLSPAFFSSAARRGLRRSAPWIRRSPGGYLSRGELIAAGNQCPPPPQRAPAALAHLDDLAAFQSRQLGEEVPPFKKLFEVRILTLEELERLVNALADLFDIPVDPWGFAEIIRNVMENEGLLGDCDPIEEIGLVLELYVGVPLTCEMLLAALRAGLAGCGMRLHDDRASGLPGFISASSLPPLDGSCRPVEERCCPVVDWTGPANGVGAAFNPHGDSPAAVNRLSERVKWPPIHRPEPLDIPIGLDYPTWTLLNKHAPEWILPGVDQVEKDTIVALRTNPRFTDAFLVGINTQFIHEMHWRGLPIDRTCTPLLMFWYPIKYSGAAQRAPDIRPIDQWRAETHVGHPQHQVVLPEDQAGRRDLVILFHSDLFRRYPSTLVYLVKVGEGENEDTFIKATPNFGDAARFAGPLFRGAIREDLVFFSFNVEPEKVSDYWLILDEPPAELRFRSDTYRELDQTFGLPEDGAETAAAVIDKPSRVAISGEELKKLGTSS